MRKAIILAVVILALNGCMGLHGGGMGHGDNRESSSNSHQH